MVLYCTSYIDSLLSTYYFLVCYILLPGLSSYIHLTPCSIIIFILLPGKAQMAQTVLSVSQVYAKDGPIILEMEPLLYKN